MSRYVHITGWGAYAPPRIVTNQELTHIVATSDEWIQERTGIVERRIADEKDYTSTMAAKAGARALERAGLLPHQLQLIILASCSPDYLIPCTACIVQDALGATRSAALDINTACSGFVYGLSLATAMIQSGQYDNALVLGAECLSRVVNWTDRTTCVLFGDGAGGVVLQAAEAEGGLQAFALGADGSGGDLLTIHLGSRTPLTLDNLANSETLIKMNGSEVYRFGSRVLNQCVREVVAKAGLEVQDIDLLIPHQANVRILQKAAKQLGLPMERIFQNLDRYGNTSSASVPLALVDAIETGRVRTGDNIVMVGFGGGLTWAGCLVQWTFDPRTDTRGPIQRTVNSIQMRVAPVRGLARRVDRRLRAMEDRVRGRDTGRLDDNGRRNGHSSD